MDLTEQVLKKKGLRSDALWTHPLIFTTPLRRIPLFFDVLSLLLSQYWPRTRLNRLANDRLDTLLQEAKLLPLWQNQLQTYELDKGDPVDQLQLLPISSKSTYAGREASEFTNVDELARSHRDFTSGSTGRPFGYYFGWRSELRCFAFCERTFYAVGHGLRHDVISMRARHRIGFIFYRHVMFYLAASADIQYRLAELLATLRVRTRPVILYGYTSWIVELAKQVRKGVSVPSVFALVATGEGIGARDRQMIEDVFQAPFYTTYATRELGWLGFECEKKRMHVNEEWAYLEIVDAQGRRLPDGLEGRIVVTTFDNTVMPFIRYDIGDRGSIDVDACSCGRTLRTITFSGRQSDIIDLGDGHTLSLLDISPLFDAYWDAVHQYQIVQTAPLDFTLRINPGPSFNDRREALQNRIRRSLHPNARLEWETVDRIEPAKSGKALYYIKAF